MFLPLRAADDQVAPDLLGGQDPLTPAQVLEAHRGQPTIEKRCEQVKAVHEIARCSSMLDVQTREPLQNRLLGIWQRERRTGIFAHCRYLKWCRSAVFVPGTGGKLLRRLERRARHAALADDRQQGSGGQLGVVRDRDRGRTLGGPALHDDVAPSAPNFGESVLLQDAADRASGEDAQSTH